MKHSKFISFFVAFILIGWGGHSYAMSFDLDSIAEWGKFPRFAVKTYRWADKFFNSYDSTYVVPTGQRFNVKFKMDSWLDTYSFDLVDDVSLRMVSFPSTSAGFWLSYMAVSVGYDVNLSRWITGEKRTRRRFDFHFNCGLFAAELYYIGNDVGTHITRFGIKDNSWPVNLDFNGINTRMLIFDAYYFLNNRKYSYSAAFTFGRVQLKSAGSFFAGFSYWYQKYNFDFKRLPYEMKSMLPKEWNYKYAVQAKNYGLKFGYGYNWVVGRNWVVGISESPTIGVKRGYISVEANPKWSFSMYNTLRVSGVWNLRKRWFVGIVGRVETSLIYDKEHTLLNNTADVDICVGYRFNLW